MKKCFWREQEFELSSLETNAGIVEHYSLMYKALDKMLGLGEGDDPDHPLSFRSAGVMEDKKTG
ncbi:hypothetical protein [uncultured Desulfobacter sp.]|uniref:hypothetical protein n=1 Tax=uncultured Desulfobacter sp. TaxID=240139 RepID=UPI002AAB6217|nr:hypothetical protein [uncultured Desulfobacter sp.]